MVKRNIARFPEDFMFQLTTEEDGFLKSQFATSSWGGKRKLPYAFTEQGIYMLATVLRGEIRVMAVYFSVEIQLERISSVKMIGGLCCI